MSNFLKHYSGIMTTLGPVHIGSGSIYKKNEYIFDAASKSISIMDIGKIYQHFIDENKADLFEKYFGNYSSTSLPLKSWLESNGKPPELYSKWSKYTIHSSDSVITHEKQNDKEKYQDILAFMKDPYGLPYVPGSSIKGMLRTALALYEIAKRDDNFKTFWTDDKIIQELDNTKDKPNRVLSRQVKDLEAELFNTLSRNKKRQSDAVNSILSGLIVGDSKPLRCEDLTICRKYDVRPDNSENVLPIFKESLKPGVKVEFDLTIDSDLCQYSIENIKKAITLLNDIVVKRFIKQFDEKYKLEDDTIGWIGSCGFTSKTLIQGFYDDNQADLALDATDYIFEKTLRDNYEQHNHNKDVKEYGVAPHMRKQTVVSNQKYDFGKVKFDFV